MEQEHDFRQEERKRQFRASSQLTNVLASRESYARALRKEKRDEFIQKKRISAVLVCSPDLAEEIDAQNRAVLDFLTRVPEFCEERATVVSPLSPKPGRQTDFV